MLRRLLLRASASSVLAGQVTQRRWARRVALRFVAGETLEDGLAVARRLAGQGKSVTLDYLGEAVASENEARAAAEVVREALDRIGRERLPAGVSVKPTQLGLDLDRALCHELLGRIASAADAVGAHLTLDMEGSAVTEATVALVEQMRADGHREVGCAVQAYLRRTPEDLRRLSGTAKGAGASLRLCKGAYLEPPDVALQTRLEVDAAYDDCVAWLLAHGTYPRLATHDHRLIARARGHAARLGVDASDYEFQMLYGVRRDLQDALVGDGLQVRVYVPFGSQWYPYFLRRIAERPANLAFFLRALTGR